MDIQTILFSFKGRIGRGTYWLSIVPVIVAVHFIAFAPILIVGFIVGTESEEIPDSILIAVFAAQLIWLAGLWPMLAVGGGFSSGGCSPSTCSLAASASTSLATPTPSSGPDISRPARS